MPVLLLGNSVSPTLTLFQQGALAFFADAIFSALAPALRHLGGSLPVIFPLLHPLGLFFSVSQLSHGALLLTLFVLGFGAAAYPLLLHNGTGLCLDLTAAGAVRIYPGTLSSGALNGGCVGCFAAANTTSTTCTVLLVRSRSSIRSATRGAPSAPPLLAG